jgi:hypothetical protein
MGKSLKYTRETLNSIKLLQGKHEYFKKEFIRLMGQTSYEQTQNYYQEVIIKLTEEIEQLPIGYRYTGVFYLKSVSLRQNCATYMLCSYWLR